MLKNEPIVKEKPKNPRKKQQAKLLLFTIFGILVLSAIPLYFLLPKEDSFRLIDYTYAEVKSRTFRELVSVAGHILAEEIVDVTAPFNCHIIQINVQNGDEVEKGTLLLQLESEELTQTLKNSEDELAIALVDFRKAELDLQIETQKYEKTLLDLEKSLAELKADLAAKRELYYLGELSQKALKDAEEAVENLEVDNNIKRLTTQKALLTTNAAFTQAKKQYALSEEKLLELEELENQKTLLSPITGKVLEVLFVPKKDVAANAVLLKMATIKNPYVDIMIPAAESEKINVGMPVLIKTASKDYPGYLDKVSFDVKQNQEIGYFISGVVKFNEDPGFILPYTECKVEIETGIRENVLYLPRGPYISTGQSMFVYKIHKNQAIKTNLVLGTFDGTNIEVVQGLSLGDSIITSSYDGFTEYKEIEISIEGGRKL